MPEPKWPINPSSTGKLPQRKDDRENGENNSKELPDYPDDFFCNFVVKALNKLVEKDELTKSIIEKVELSTKREDYREKADFWLKIVRMDDPIGVQFTASGDGEIIEKKRKELEARKYITKKEQRDDAEIKYSGNTTLVLVEENKERLINYIKAGERKSIDPAEIPGPEYTRDFLAKVFLGLAKANPAKHKIIMSIMTEVVRRLKNKK